MFDLKKIKSIPCQNITDKYGIKLEKKHNRLWGKLRNEKEPSFSINLENNLWYDFGTGEGGSVIDLLMKLENITLGEAIKQLADEFGIEEELEAGNWQPLTDNQYRKLGLQPERATMNFKIDLTKHDIKLVEKWSKKYGIPLKELAKKYPKLYNDMVSKIALENINSMRNLYFERLKMFKRPETDTITRDFLKAMSKDDSVTINENINLLQRALTINKDYSYLKVYPEKDFVIEHNQSYSRNINSDINRMIETYKNKHDYHKIDNFTKEQKIALYEVNNIIYDDMSSVLSIIALKELYKTVGQKLEKIDSKNTNYSAIKKLFNDLAKVMSAIKDAEIKEVPKVEKTMNLSKNFDLSR